MASIINASSTGSGGLISTGDASGVLQLQNNGTVALAINNGNSLMVGSATPVTFGSSAGLQLASGSFLYNQSNTYTMLSQNAYWTGSNDTAIATGASSRYYQGGGAHYWSTAPSVTGGTACSYVNLATLTATGNLTFGQSNAGIVFNNSSALTNSTLNDYETGTWTPTATYGTGSATLSANGQYVKIGRLVTITYQLSFSGSSSTSGVQITNFPFSVGTGSGSGVMREGTQTGYFWTIVGTAGTASGYLFQYVNNQNLPNGSSSFTGTYSYYASF